MVTAHGEVAVLDAAGDHLRTWPTANFPAEIARAYALIPVSPRMTCRSGGPH